MKEITSFEGAAEFFGAYNQGLKDMQEFTCEHCGGRLYPYETDDAGNRFDECRDCKFLTKITI